MRALKPLSAVGAGRRYGADWVVRGATLALTPGTVTALLGPSGAGKSTLLRLMAGLEPVDEGEIRLGDEVISRPGHTRPPERRKTGLIFQDFALFPHMTALQNVGFGLARLPKPEARRRALKWLERLGLAPRAEAYPHQLSGGEQQRVAIARALAPEPAAILMDEPFSGLDPVLRAGVREAALDAIRDSGPPALLVTHSAAEALGSANQLALMRAGRIVQAGPPETLYRAPADADIAAALGPVSRFAAADAPAGLVEAGPEEEICVREEAVRLDPASPHRARVLHAAFLGPHTRLHLEIGTLDLNALVAPDIAPAVGDEVAISLDPPLTFRFPATKRS